MSKKFIEDHNKSKLYYHFSPATLLSNFIPLIVILDDKKEDEAIHFEFEMWNVLTIINTPTPYERVNWYNLESEDTLIKDLIETIAEEFECEEHIYFYINSIHTAKAMDQSIQAEANAIFLHVKEAMSQDDRLNSSKNLPILYTDEREELLQHARIIAHYHERGMPVLTHKVQADSEQVKIQKILKFLAQMVSQV